MSDTCENIQERAWLEEEVRGAEGEQVLNKALLSLAAALPPICL